MGIIPDLKLVGNDFTNASTAFFIAYLIAEVPNGTSQAPKPPHPPSPKLPNRPEEDRVQK